MTGNHSSQAIVKGRERKPERLSLFCFLKFPKNGLANFVVERHLLYLITMKIKINFEFITSESVMTFTNVPVDIINTSGIILARIGHAFIDVNFAGFT